MVEPSLNLTVPVGITPVEEVTAAVKVPVVPDIDGLGRDRALGVGAFTYLVSVANALVANVASPLYVALIERDHVANELVLASRHSSVCQKQTSP